MAMARPNPKMRAALAQQQYERGVADGRKQIEKELYDNGRPGKPEDLTLSDVHKMTADEINSRWDEVSEVLARAEADTSDAA